MAGTEKSSWGLEEGDEIAPGRTALRLLGGGSRYEAYLAFDDHLHSIVVIKVLRPDRVEDEDSRRRLAREADILDELQHPVIVRAFDAVTEGPRPHLVLEHLEGPRLSTLLRRYGTLATEQLVPLAVQLCSALHYMHAESTVHLDIKPSNVIMAGPPRMIDLSVARSFEEAAELTSSVGTDAFKSPEQCDPDRLGPVGAAADVWGLGATLQQAATGERAFGRGDRDATDPAERYPQLVDAPAPLDGVDQRVVAPIAACLEVDPGDRPSAEALAESFEAILGELPRPRARRRTR